MKTRYLFLLLVLSCKLALADLNNEAHISIKQLEARISTLEDLLQELQAKSGSRRFLTSSPHTTPRAAPHGAVHQPLG